MVELVGIEPTHELQFPLTQCECPSAHGVTFSRCCQELQNMELKHLYLLKKPLRLLTILG
jgi:hypothetical protein